MAAPVVPDQWKALISTPSNLLCGNFINAILRLPNLLWQFFKWMFDSDGNLTEEFVLLMGNALGFRTGDKIESFSQLDEVGRLLCNGRQVSRTTYARLFAKIGTAYGAGDGVTTFHIPDCTDRFPIGAGVKPLAQKAGTFDMGMLLESQLPRHTHYFGVEAGAQAITVDSEGGRLRTGGGDSVDWQTAATTKAGETRAYGSGTPDDQVAVTIPIQPYIAVYVYILT